MFPDLLDSLLPALSSDASPLRWLAYMAAAIAGGLVIFFGVSLPLHYRYYVKRREQARDWKCQPTRWLPDHLNRQALRLSTLNMTIGGALSGTYIEYIARGGYTTLYYDLDEHGLVFTLVTTTLAFLWSDATAYYIHRAIHTRWLYRHIHRHHHRYVATTPFVTIAMHPLELISQQIAIFTLLFVLPVYAPAFVALLIYILAYNIIDHSGVKLTSRIPWQPSSRFHDDHHRFFHCNFGQHLSLWDRLHGTLRRADRRYGEDVFGGRGSGGGDDDDRFVRY
ncbi:MAG: sterol desaturase family protein [Myxococcales bacterium]|nr:sterol desaturase family protein [Myxococcales bacterium]